MADATYVDVIDFMFRRLTVVPPARPLAFVVCLFLDDPPRESLFVVAFLSGFGDLYALAVGLVAVGDRTFVIVCKSSFKFPLVAALRRLE